MSWDEARLKSKLTLNHLPSSVLTGCTGARYKSQTEVSGWDRRVEGACNIPLLGPSCHSPHLPNVAIMR